MKEIQVLTVSLILPFFLTGCSGKQNVIETETLSVSGCDGIVLNNLTNAVRKSGSHLDTLRRLKQKAANGNSDISSSQPPPASSILWKNVTVYWDGPLESVLTVLGNIVEYKIEITGNRPAQPVMVSLNTQGVPLFKIFEDVGWQAGNNTIIVRDDKRHVLKIVYSKG